MKDIRIECTAADMVDPHSLVVIQKDLKSLSTESYEHLKAEIDSKGFSFAIHVWKDKKARLCILDGTQRLRTVLQMIKEGWSCPKVPVAFVEAKSHKDAIKKLLGAAGAYGRPDKQGLYELMTENELVMEDLVNIELPGIDLDSFEDEFFKSDQVEDEEAIPDKPEDPKTKPGDLWILGPHRLLCGDSLRPDLVNRVTEGKLVHAVFTDPPYGVSYVPIGGESKHKKIENDDLDEKKLAQFLTNAFKIWPLVEGGTFYVCSPPGNLETVFRLCLGDAGFQIRQCIVWVKDQFVMGRQDYHWRHESILYGWKDGKAHYFVDDRTQDTVWEVPRPKKSEEHPTMKPLELVARAMKNSTRKGQVIFDGFGGSGTTLIAAHTLGRACRTIEFDPGYCDVILTRWSELTGEDPVREDGAKWSSLSERPKA